MLGFNDDRSLSEILPKKEAQALAKAWGIKTVAQLLSHHPRTYARQGQGIPLEWVAEGEFATCMGQIIATETRTTSRGVILSIVVDTGTSQARATFFQAQYLQKYLVQGLKILLNGKVKYFHNRAELQHPDYLILSTPTGRNRSASFGGLGQLKNYDEDEIVELLQSFEYLPIYPAKKGFSSWRMTAAIHRVLSSGINAPDLLGKYKPAGLMDLHTAIQGVHQFIPVDPRSCQVRFAYDEALTLAVVLQLRRKEVAARQAVSLTSRPDGCAKKLMKSLPYNLTQGQERIVSEIFADLHQTHPMQRLLQGEVGSGKTVVALIAMLQAVDNGKQCALLVPTEVLAHQHGRSLEELLSGAGLDVNVVVLTGSLPMKKRREVLLQIVSGDADIIVGTHALIQNSVEFFDLGLCVIDEQHRFGVEQRDSLRGKGRDGTTPHLLVMTATPIPRTVAMTFFSDLNHSVLKELPGGRRPITTRMIPDYSLDRIHYAMQVIRTEVQRGHQIYVVCPRITGDGGVDDMYEKMTRGPLQGMRVGRLHGQMHSEDKDTVMRQFADHELDVLIATTVIEVGIDVPNATVMLVREAENFGMSQLHQLRGRVGRGGNASICFFHHSGEFGSNIDQRIQQMSQTIDGFEVADLDLEYRREGDVLGVEQSGRSSNLQYLDLKNHAKLIEHANNDAQIIVEQDIAVARQIAAQFDEQSAEFLDKT